MNEKYTSNLISNLISHYGFTVEEYKVLGSTEKAWIAIRYLENRIFAIIITSVDDYIYKVNSAKEFLHGKNSDYILNNIIIIENMETIQGIIPGYGYNTLVLNPYEGNIIKYSEGSDTLVNIVTNILNPKKQKNSKTPLKGNNFFNITNVLIGINILMYILSAYLSGSIMNINTGVLVFLGAKVNTLINYGQYYRLITAMFLHGGLAHIGFNMYALRAIGTLVEEIYGRKKFLVIYFGAGIFSSYISYIFSNAISVGASGAIFGLFGASLIIGIRMRHVIGKDFLRNILSVILMNIVIGLSASNIDNFAHFGGLVGGVIISLLIFKEK